MSRLEYIGATMNDTDSIAAKLDKLDTSPGVLDQYRALELNLSDRDEYLIKQMIAAGQGHIIERIEEPQLSKLLKVLDSMERFYDAVGGILGYQKEVERLLSGSQDSEEVTYAPPNGLKLTDEAAAWGLSHLGELAEIYPVGGAADRLGLHGENGEPRPAACLPFLGRSLLEGLIRDLQAREYLYYTQTGEQICVPVAMMTSEEKDNDLRIREICTEKQWFGRGPDAFFLFPQPKVPVFTEDGKWFKEGNLTPLWKPGGHGVIWRLAQISGVFKWFEEQGRKKALVRQINNPIAGVDTTLLAFSGIGLKQDALFGFASCPRRESAKEGLNVVKTYADNRRVLSNVEYCDLAGSSALEGSEDFSSYPANANLLFIDIGAVDEATRKRPYPGEIINFKDGASARLARLELTMQNIADDIDQGPNAERAYLTLGPRNKTLSATKKQYQGDGKLLETPEGVYCTHLENCHELLNQCGVDIPEFEGPGDYAKELPALIFVYHPALGPLYSTIAQKIRGGKIAKGSELQLEIAQLQMRDLDLDGSLVIETESVMGHIEGDRLIYSDRAARVEIERVVVRNAGVDRNGQHCLWQNQIERKEALKIVLGEGSVLTLRNTTLKGNQTIEVPPGEHLIIDGGENE